LNTIHLIYPFDLKRKTTPWEEGNQIYFALKDKFNFKIYSWLSTAKINPEEGDILLGHTHSNPLTIFRRSMKNSKWKKVIMYQPYNEDIYSLSYLYSVLPHVDIFLALCGPYWFKRIKKSIFSPWKKKIQHINLGIDYKEFKFLKKKFNKSQKRKFLYIGNDYQYNNFAKNTKYLEQISNFFDKKTFGCMGNKKFKKMNNYGWVNLKSKNVRKILSEYDFLIHTSTNDANPSTILEAMSWGLIPVTTKQCGYDNEKGIINIPLKDLDSCVKILKKLQSLPNRKLLYYQRQNYQRVKQFYNWNNFRKKIRSIVLSKNKFKNKANINLNKKLKEKFENYEKKSSNYYLKLNMILIIIKANISILIKNLLKLNH
jgi:hypothetical protein